MGKFRVGLGIFLILMGPLLFHIAGDAERQGIRPGEADGSRGAALFDLLGQWGLLLVMVGFGLAEVARGRALLKDRRDEEA